MKLPDNTFLRHVVWMLCNDVGYISTYAHNIKRATRELGPELAHCIDTAIKHFEEYEELITEDAYKMWLADAPDVRSFSKELALQTFQDSLPVETNGLRQFIYDHTDSWAKEIILSTRILEASQLVEQGEVDAAEQILADVPTELSAVKEVELGMSLDEEDGLETFWTQTIDKYHPSDSNTLCIPTGMPSVDRVLAGGLRGSELGIFMAPPGRGKSRWLCFVARNAFLLGYSVFYYTLEMSSQIVGQRILTGIIDIPFNDFDERGKEAKRRSSEHLQRVKNNYPNAGIVIKEFQAQTASVSDLRAHIELSATRQDRLPDLICIDYGDLLKSDRKYDARKDELAWIYTDIRGLGQSYKVPVWSASQTNRQGFSRDTPLIIDVADSWDKVKIADYVMALAQTEAELQNNEARMAWLKARNNEIPPPMGLALDFSRSMFIEAG